MYVYLYMTPYEHHHYHLEVHVGTRLLAALKTPMSGFSGGLEVQGSSNQATTVLKTHI